MNRKTCASVIENIGVPHPLITIDRALTTLLIRGGLLWIFIQLPFAAGAFRIDDPYHLKAAEHLQTSPGDPYGFYINWNGTPEWAFRTYASPPLLPAWLALWSTVFPRNEISLHLAMLPFSVAALVGLGLLARSYRVDCGIAMALLACSPAFFLTSQVLMPDIVMLCLFLLAVAGARLYQSNGRASALAVACIAAFCCPLAKYNGVVVVPVLMCLALVRERRVGIIGVAMAPVLSLVLWGGFTWAKYGAVHFLAMSAYQRNPAMGTHPAVITVGILAATGIGVLPLSLLGFFSRSQNRPPFLKEALGLTLVTSVWFAVKIGYGIASVLLFALSVSLSVYVIGLAIVIGWQSLRRFEWSLMPLVAWIVAGFGFQYGLMFAATRYLLFLAPPVILLVLKLSAPVARQAALVVALAANLFFTVLLAVGDLEAASVYRNTARGEIRSRLENEKGRFYFVGHWGFQYYAEKIGGAVIDKLNPPILSAGDLIVIAKTPWPEKLDPPVVPGLDVETSTLAVKSLWPVRTVSCAGGINFYGNAISGCVRPTFLPFGFSSEPLETFLMYRMRESHLDRQSRVPKLKRDTRRNPN